MFNLVVVGAGEVVTKFLYPAVKGSNPDLGMKIAVVIDVLPFESLASKAKNIIQAEGAEYVQANNLTSLRLPENPVAMVMTPNASHVAYAQHFAQLGVPVYVEKPVAVSAEDLEVFLQIERERPGLLYAAEASVDGKGLGLLALTGALRDEDPRLAFLSFYKSPLYRGLPGKTLGQKGSLLLRELGGLKRIYGKMLEEGGVNHRPWLLAGKQGGVIRDLISHLFGILYESGLINGCVSELEVKLGRHEKGKIRPLKSAEEGETYALIKGRFLDPHGMPSFTFEVGKYQLKNARLLLLAFERGDCMLEYEKNLEEGEHFNCLFRKEERGISISVTAEHYSSLALLDFKGFLEGKQHGHIGRAAAIVRFNELARTTGLNQAGLC